MKFEVGDRVYLFRSGNFATVVSPVSEEPEIFNVRYDGRTFAVARHGSAMEHVHRSELNNEDSLDSEEDCTLDEASLRVENDRLRKSRDEYKEAFEDFSEDNERLLADWSLEVEHREETLRGIYRALYSTEPEDSELIWNALREEIEVTKKNEKEFMELYKRQSERADQAENDRDAAYRLYENLINRTEPERSERERERLRFQEREAEHVDELADMESQLNEWRKAAQEVDQELVVVKDELADAKNQRDEWQSHADRLSDSLVNARLQRDSEHSRAQEAEHELNELKKALRTLGGEACKNTSTQ